MKYSINIFEKKIDFPALVMVFNSKIVGVENNDTNTNIVLADESETKKRYSSVMYFKDDDELEKYKKQLNNKKLQIFKDTEYAHEYLNK